MKRRRDYKDNFGNNNQNSNPNQQYNENYKNYNNGNLYEDNQNYGNYNNENPYENNQNYGNYNNDNSYVNNQNYSNNSYNNYDNYNTQQYNNYGNNEYSNYENNNSYNNYETYNYDPNLSDEYYDDTQNEFYEEKPEEQKPKKNLFLISFLSALAILLVAGGAYFGYTKFIKESKQTVDLSQYEIEFSPYGEDGEGKPSADIKKIPNVETNDASVKEFLQDPSITYNKNNNLRNGDKVEVSITLSKATANSKKLELVGEFKRSYTVKGLAQKQKENKSVKEDNSKSSSNTNVFRENSSVDTKKLSESDLKSWAKTIYIKDNNRNSTKSDYSADVWLGSDNLAYVNVKRGDSTVAKYRVNSRGQLEQNSSGSSWNVVSNVFTE